MFRIPCCSQFCFRSQVADLDDEFADLLLTDFSDNFDAVSSSKVSVVSNQSITPYSDTVTLFSSEPCRCAPSYRKPYGG